MEIQNIIQYQLQQFYAVIAQERDNRVKVRNWSITIWLAYLTLVSSGKLQITKFNSLMVMLFIVFIFWAVEGFHQSLVLVNEGRAAKLEKLLADSQLPRKIPLELFYENGYNGILWKHKAKCFFKACITSEPIFFFHFAMIVGSILFVYLLNIVPTVVRVA